MTADYICLVTSALFIYYISALSEYENLIDLDVLIILLFEIYFKNTVKKFSNWNEKEIRVRGNKYFESQNWFKS